MKSCGKISYKIKFFLKIMNFTKKKLFLLVHFGRSQHIATYQLPITNYLDQYAEIWIFSKMSWFYEFLKKLAKSQEKHVIWMILKFESQILSNFFFIFAWKFLISSEKMRNLRIWTPRDTRVEAKFKNVDAARHSFLMVVKKV